VAAMVCHDALGGGRFGRGSVDKVVGGDEGGGALAISGAEGGGRWEAAHMHAHEEAVAVEAVWPGEEDDQVGPTCWRERVGRAG
jgi:hypothetical protein